MKISKFTQKDRYGNTMSYEFAPDEKPLDPTAIIKHQMELEKPDMEIDMVSVGVPPMQPPVGGEEFNMGNPVTHPGEPRGQDTVPAWLTPGEFVVNAEAMSVPHFAKQVEDINNAGRKMQQGGGVPHHMLNEGGGIGIPAAGRGSMRDVADATRWHNENMAGWRHAGWADDPDDIPEDFKNNPGHAYLGHSDDIPMPTDYFDVATYNYIPEREDYTAAERARISAANEQIKRHADANRKDDGTVDWAKASREWQQDKGNLNRTSAEEQAANRAKFNFNSGGDVKYAFLGGLFGGKEVDVPVPMSPSEVILRDREGKREDVYMDSLNNPTVGIGHRLPDEWSANVGQKPFRDEQIEYLFRKDMEAAKQSARDNVGAEAYDKLNRYQQTALNSMAFQLGAKGQRKFDRMIKAIQAGDHKAAAREALTGKKGGKSLWLKQTPKRALDLAHAFDPDLAAQYQNQGGMTFDDMGTQMKYFKAGGCVGRYNTGGNVDDYMSSQGYEEPSMWSRFADWATQDNRPANMVGDIPMIDDESSTPPPAPPAEPAVIPEDSAQAQMQAQQIAQADNMIAGGDGDDLGTAPTDVPAPPSLEEPAEESWWDWATKDNRPDSVKEAEASFNKKIAEGNRAEVEEQLANMEERKAQGKPVNEKTLAGLKKALDHQDNQVVESTTKAAEEGAITSEEADATISAVHKDKQNRTMLDNEAAMEEAAGVGTGKGKVPVTYPDNETPTDGDNPNLTDRPSAEGDKEIEKIIANANSDQRKQVQNEAKGILSDLGLDSLFDKKELARMAVMYGASRLLGYGHGGSLQWAAKQYIGRVDKKEAAFNQLALSGKYTPESLKSYKESGDILDLAPVGVAPKALGNFKTFYGPNGKQVRAEEMDIGGQKVWVGANGQRINTSYHEDASRAAGTPEHTKRVQEEGKDYAAMFKGQQDLLKANMEQGDFRLKMDSATQGRFAAEWAIKNGVDANDMPLVIQQAYDNARAEGKDKISDIRPYLNDVYIKSQVGSTHAELFTGAAPTKIQATIQGPVAQLMAQQPSLSKSAAQSKFVEAQVAQWTQLQANKPEEYQEYLKSGKGGGYSPFLLFMHDNIAKARK